MKKSLKHFSIAFIAGLMLIVYTFSAFQVSAAEKDIEDIGYSWGVELNRNLTMDVGETTEVYGTYTYDYITDVIIDNTNDSVIDYYKTGITGAEVIASAPGTTTLTITVFSEYYGPNYTYDYKKDIVHYNITVNQKLEVKVSSVRLSKSSATIYKGNTLRLNATVSPSNADNKKITWTSSSKSVATVSSNGVVKGKKAGTATITAKSSNGKKATCKVRVKKSVAVKKVALNKKSAKIYVGKTLKLKAAISPSNASNKKVTWSSSNKSIATVNSKGVVKGKKAGTATITAKSSNGKKATCKVKVKNVAVKKVALNKKSAKIYVGKTLRLKATISPSNATNKKVTWSSSNKSVATVSTNGVVKGKKAGTATITAKSNNGKKATCKVRVNNVAVTRVALNRTSASINVGKTVTLKATVSPSNATNKKVTWSSSNRSVATVNSRGVVTGKKAGTAIITAKANNGRKATCKITVKSSDPYLANFDKLREYINYNYDYIDEEGKNIGMDLIDPDGDELAVTICLLPDNSLSFYCNCKSSDSNNPYIISVQFNEADFSKSYTVDAYVGRYYNDELDFVSNYVFNAKSYHYPMEETVMQITNYTGRFTDEEIVELTDNYVNYALDGFDFVLKDRIGLSIQDIGFVNF